MFGDEDAVAVLGGELAAGVEAHAERGDVRAELLRRWGEVAAGALCAEFGVGDVAAVAVGKAEVQAGRGGAVQLVGRAVVAEPVAAVVGEPQFAAGGVPVEADAVAHAVGEGVRFAAVRAHAQDRRVATGGGFADVAWGADRYVEPAVRAEAEVFPAVVGFPGQVVADDGRRRRGVDAAVDVVEAQDAVDGGDVQGAVAPGDAAGHPQVVGNDARLSGPVVAVERQGVHLAGAQRADVEDVPWRERHLAGVRHARQEFDGEARR